MNVLYVAYYTVIRSFRDVKSILNMLVFPIVLTLILGTALDKAYSPTSIGKTSVCFLNMDNGAEAERFEEFLNYDEIDEMIDVTMINSKEEGSKLINEGKASAMIVIGKGFSEAPYKGKKALIEVHGSKNGSFRASIARNIVDSYVNGANTEMAIRKLDIGQGRYNYTESIQEEPIAASGTVPKAIDYYAVTMLVMVIMYGSLYSVHGMGEDYLEKMGPRLRSTPVSTQAQMVGKILGTFFVIFAQAIVLLLFTKYMYKANWGDDPLSILFVAISLTMLSIGMGTMFSMVVKSRIAASGLVSTVIPIVTFMSGGYAKIETSSQLFNNFRYLMPNHLAQTAIFNNIYGGPQWQTQLCIGIIWTMTVIMLVIGALAGRRRLA